MATFQLFFQSGRAKDLLTPLLFEPLTDLHIQALYVIRMGRGLTHLISTKGLKSLPCYSDRWLYAGKWFFCSGKYLRRGLLASELFLNKVREKSIPDLKFCSVCLHTGAQ